jgi:hypothetical protein
MPEILSLGFENTGFTLFPRCRFLSILNLILKLIDYEGSCKMGVPEDKQKNLTAFQSGPLEDLTIQDGLIISAVYAVHADTEKCNQIKGLAQKHPLFVEKSEDTSARVNKFTNLMQGGQSLKAVEAVTRSLKPAHRKQAFEFALEATLADGVFTEKKKKTFLTLATKLALDNEFVDHKLATIQDKSDR